MLSNETLLCIALSYKGNIMHRILHNNNNKILKRERKASLYAALNNVLKSSEVEKMLTHINCGSDVCRISALDSHLQHSIQHYGYWKMLVINLTKAGKICDQEWFLINHNGRWTEWRNFPYAFPITFIKLPSTTHEWAEVEVLQDIRSQKDQ